jgi:1-phosphatidylinositol-3-phosphate 5-kinase
LIDSFIHFIRSHNQYLCNNNIKFYFIIQKPEVVMDLVRQVVSNIRPHVKFGDKMDPRYYVKIKKICGGSLDECTYVDGIAFTKNRAHKKQRSDIKNARVLLLGCSVEFERKEQRLVSFDKLLVQEREYLKILVSKIASMKPDVVLVEKSISRPAQDMLVEAGICFAVNVKPHLMHVVARISQCTILQSTGSYCVFGWIFIIVVIRPF